MSRVTDKATIYLDYASSTPIDGRVQEEIAAAFKLYGNPSSFNDSGRLAKKKLEESRLAVARFIGARPDEIIFTSSGSESNNLAILGTLKSFQTSSSALTKVKRVNPKPQIPKPHIITTQTEHLSVLEPIRQLEHDGIDVTYLPVDREGFIGLDELRGSLRPETTLVSIMYANNEIGTIQPIAKIGKIISDFRNRKLQIHERTYPFSHIDACQAVGYLELNVNNLGVDLMTFNGTKIYGPRGAGILYAKRGVNLAPQILGGRQESGRRAGTENLPAIAGLAKAVSLINPKKESAGLSSLRDYFFKKILEIMPEAKINGPTGDNRLANNINISIPGLDSENILLELDKYGIRASSGSACTSRYVEPSHVLRAIGVEKKYLNGAVRLSMGRQTTKKDINYVLGVFSGIAKDLNNRYAE